ncbi:MAG: hypothetical protein RIQ62_1862 [Bacteroidota bacterium]
MKKIIFIASSMLLSTSLLQAQCLPKGSMNVSVGYGYNAFVNSTLKTWTDELNFKYSVLGPIHTKFEYMLGERVGLGLSINYISYKTGYDFIYDIGNGPQTYKETDKFSSLSALIRSNFYYVNSDKVAVYSGLGIGYKSYAWKYSNNAGITDYNVLKNVIPPVGFELTTGVKFMFTPNIGLYTEVGFAKSIIQAGMCFGFGGSGGSGGGMSAY